AAFEASAAPMALARTDGGLHLVNRAWTRLLGPDPGGVHALLHPDDPSGYADLLDDLAAGSRDAHRGRVRLLTAGGGSGWAEAATTLVRDEAGRPAFVHVVLLEVTKEVVAAQAV